MLQGDMRAWRVVKAPTLPALDEDAASVLLHTPDNTLPTTSLRLSTELSLKTKFSLSGENLRVVTTALKRNSELLFSGFMHRSKSEENNRLKIELWNQVLGVLEWRNTQNDNLTWRPVLIGTTPNRDGTLQRRGQAVRTPGPSFDLQGTDSVDIRCSRLEQAWEAPFTNGVVNLAFSSWIFATQRRDFGSKKSFHDDSWQAYIIEWENNCWSAAVKVLPSATAHRRGFWRTAPESARLAELLLSEKGRGQSLPKLLGEASESQKCDYEAYARALHGKFTAEINSRDLEKYRRHPDAAPFEIMPHSLLLHDQVLAGRSPPLTQLWRHLTSNAKRAVYFAHEVPQTQAQLQAGPVDSHETQAAQLSEMLSIRSIRHSVAAQRSWIHHWGSSPVPLQVLQKSVEGFSFPVVGKTALPELKTRWDAPFATGCIDSPHILVEDLEESSNTRKVHSILVSSYVTQLKENCLFLEDVPRVPSHYGDFSPSQRTDYDTFAREVYQTHHIDSGVYEEHPDNPSARHYHAAIGYSLGNEYEPTRRVSRCREVFLSE